MTTPDKEINFRKSRKINLLVQSTSSFISFNVHWCLTNPNRKTSYKISPRLISKTRCMWCCAIALAYTHRKAYLSKQLQWRAAGDPCLARGRSWVRALAMAPRERFFLHPPGLQKMFSLSGTFISNGQNFLSNMCAKHTSRARSAKSLRPGSRARLRALEAKGILCSQVHSGPIFEPFLCKI